MSENSDSEEFYDAEEFTPIKGSKRASLCKNLNISSMVVDKDVAQTNKSVDKKLVLALPKTNEEIKTKPEEDDRTIVKNVVQGRKRFQELRRCMQTDEEEDTPETDAVDSSSYTLEQPFKIISHDTMSLQSMTSLGRIGKILSGASESHPNIRDTIPSSSGVSSAREPSTVIYETGIAENRNQSVLPLAEPDVIASTKANSLKMQSSSVVAMSSVETAPRPPPRRKKREKLHGSQSLTTTDGDNISVCTTDTDELNHYQSPRKYLIEKPQQLSVEPLQNVSHQSISLPSPASTIESLTREFQDSLELSQSKYGLDNSTRNSISSKGSNKRNSQVDVSNSKSSAGGDHLPKSPQDDRLGRTHSESRAPNTGHSSLGSNTRRAARALDSPRRRSAGDEQLALTPAPAQLSDSEILERVTVVNLDTGEKMPLSVAEQKIPQCINPLSLHIMRITSEYSEQGYDEERASPEPKIILNWRKRLSFSLYGSTFNIARKSSLQPARSSIEIDQSNRETDEESVGPGGREDDNKESKREDHDRQPGAAIKRKTEKLKRFLGSTVKKTVDAAKSLAQEVSHARHKEDVCDIPDEVNGESSFKLKASTSHRGPYDFDNCLTHVQEMSSGSNAVWCCKFSVCGRLLATAGQDRLLRIWVTRDSFQFFQALRIKYNASEKSSPTPSQSSLAELGAAPPPGAPPPAPLKPSAPFCAEPFCVYAGHSADLLDVSWSKNYFLLSSSMDKTVRLWHISRAECLCCFQHIDFVTAIAFHPRDDRYFLSGSLDGKLRLWNIPDKKVSMWNEVDGKSKLITAANFCQNGKVAVVGTYDGRCIFYVTDTLKYHTQIDVRSTRGKNSTGRKISGIEPMPDEDKILVTSNDSRVRLYDLRDLNLSCKYKGFVNASSQIKASFSPDGKYIVSGSENQSIFIWKTCHDYSKFSSVRRDRNDFWEGIKAHSAVVTCAVFAPHPDYLIKAIAARERDDKRAQHQDVPEDSTESMVASTQTGHVLVSADYNGQVRVFLHKAKPKHSSLPASALA